MTPKKPTETTSAAAAAAASTAPPPAAAAPAVWTWMRTSPRGRRRRGSGSAPRVSAISGCLFASRRRQPQVCVGGGGFVSSRCRCFNYAFLLLVGSSSSRDERVCMYTGKALVSIVIDSCVFLETAVKREKTINVVCLKMSGRHYFHSNVYII